MTQSSFSFATVPVRKTTKRKQKAAPSLTAESIAKLIDPDAWAVNPSPSRERLEVELAKSREEIKALRDEIEWLQAASKTEGKPFSDPVLIRKAGQDTILKEDAVARQEAALAIATTVMAACKRAIGGERSKHFLIGMRRFKRKG